MYMTTPKKPPKTQTTPPLICNKQCNALLICSLGNKLVILGTYRDKCNKEMTDLYSFSLVQRHDWGNIPSGTPKKRPISQTKQKGTE